MNASVDSVQPGSKPLLLRSGTAARLAGVSSSTLRIWEHRYGVVSPPRSPSGQRTYSMADVQRLRLIRQLTSEGHAIGTVANLDVDELGSLASGSRLSAEGRQRVLVVGHGAARKLKGRLGTSPVLVFDDLGDMESKVIVTGAADVLVVHVPSLQPNTPERILALRTVLPVVSVVVVYAFGTEAVAEALRAAGVVVRREPVTGRELARLVASARPFQVAPARGAQIDPRHYDDAELVALTEIASSVACECPRHLAEIVTMLVGFELYSTECASRSPADAALHRHLGEVTGVARTLLEQALSRVIAEEGL
ncbi:MAG: MerR family transcriptional regulator [Burkholderiaceae bacterium]